ncbi:MAG: amidase family protein [Candidatus Saccharibacteria bacterium]
MIGTYVLRADIMTLTTNKLRQLEQNLLRNFAEAFKKYDFLVGPTAATTAFKLGEFTDDPLAMYLNDIMTVAANLVGIPAITLPVGSMMGCL